MKPYWFKSHVGMFVLYDNFKKRYTNVYYLVITNG